MRKSIFYLVFCFLITGCSITKRDITQSERQGITYTGTDPIFIGMMLNDEMLKLGYDIAEQSTHSIIFEKRITGWTGDMWPENRCDMQPYSRVSYTLIEQDGTVQVVADLKMITKPDSRFGRLTDTSHRPDSGFERVAETAHHPDSKSIKEVLQKVEDQLEHQKESLEHRRE